MGKPPQATFNTEPSGKTKSAKRKKETEVGGVFCLNTVDGGKI